MLVLGRSLRDLLGFWPGEVVRTTFLFALQKRGKDRVMPASRLIHATETQFPSCSPFHSAGNSTTNTLVASCYEVEAILAGDYRSMALT